MGGMGDGEMGRWGDGEMGSILNCIPMLNLCQPFLSPIQLSLRSRAFYQRRLAGPSCSEHTVATVNYVAAQHVLSSVFDAFFFFHCLFCFF